jgi:phenylacetic acid degradation operon negative regulatory protein
MGINEGVVRTAMSRLAADGWLERHRLGRNSFYRLADKGHATFARAAERIYGAHPRSWTGRFRLVLLPSTADRQSAREALQAAGFGSPLPGLFVAPEAASVPEEARDALVLAAGDDIDACRRLAAQSWPLERTGLAYRRLLDAFEPLRVWVAAGRVTSDVDALLARLLLVHEYRRAVLRDPLLPAPLLPPDWPGTAARALCAAIYPALLPASERWLDAHALNQDGPLPPPSVPLAARFCD